jgi:outer membrane protein assembly factor BamE (lipoprotein component of BamABCDE complex)
MRRRLIRSTLTGCVLVALAGCSSYRYMRDSSADIERSRLDYVENNPGNKFNDDIASGKVRKGMSRLQVRVTWGDPDQVAPQGPGTETWSYEETEPARGTSLYHLRFEGELLASIDIDRAALDLDNTEDPSRSQRDDGPGATRADSEGKPGQR